VTSAVTGLSALGADVQWTDAAAAAAAGAALRPGAGRLGELAQWLAGAQGAPSPEAPARPRLVAVADVVPDVLRDAAERIGVGIDQATTPADVPAACAGGVAIVDRAVDSGTDLLVLAGGADDAAAATVCLITGVEPVALLPRGAAAVDTRSWIARAAALRNTLRRISPLREVPDEMLTALGSPALALSATVLMHAAFRRTPVLFDGRTAAAAAVLCHDVQPRAVRWWLPADDSPDPVCRRALSDLARDPVLNLGLTRDDGLAGLLAVAVVQAAAALVRETDRAGESDEGGAR